MYGDDGAGPVPSLYMIIPDTPDPLSHVRGWSRDYYTSVAYVVPVHIGRYYALLFI